MTRPVVREFFITTLIFDELQSLQTAQTVFHPVKRKI
jgi:hypothetical protein